MDEHDTKLHNANSGFYTIPTRKTKEPWNCRKALYTLITISSAITIGLLVGCFSKSLILFCSCLYGCKKFNRKLFSERNTDRFTATDVFYAIQAICIYFLKTALIYYLIAIFAAPIVLIVVVVIAANSVFKIFK